MKYYAGNLSIVHEEHETRATVLIAATSRAQAERLHEHAASTYQGMTAAVQDEQGYWRSEGSPEVGVRTGLVREISAVTFQEMQGHCLVLGEDAHNLERLQLAPQAKALAHRIGNVLKRLSAPVAHGKLLHAVSASIGETDWQVLYHKHVDLAHNGTAEGPPVQLYQNCYEPAPPTAAWPIDPKYWQQYVDTDDGLVTFTAQVPLAQLVQGDLDSLIEYCEEAFGGSVGIVSPEFRPVRMAVENEEFDEQLIGDVQLQVTCALKAYGE